MLFHCRVSLRSQMNVTDSNVAICFKDSSGNEKDCLHATVTAAASSSLSQRSSGIHPGSDFHVALGQLTGSSSCFVDATVTDLNNNPVVSYCVSNCNCKI